MKVTTSAIIVDDEPSAIQNLKIVCSRLDVDVIESVSQPELAVEMIEKHKPNLVLLDVEMPQMDGIEVLQKLSETGWDGKVVMVTAHNDYMLDAFRNYAFDFVLKPVDVDELAGVLKRLNTVNDGKHQIANISKLTQALSNKIKIRTTYENYYLNPSDIFYCEADGKYTSIHKTDGESLLTSVNLGSMEDILPDSDFCRINKSYIVNCNYLVKTDRKAKTCILSANGLEKELQFSKTYTKHLENFF